jgi:hypothetical protein
VFDVVVIVCGMSLGGIVASAVAAGVFGLDGGAVALISLVGSLCGAVAGYAIVWLMKVRPAEESSPAYLGPPQVVGSLCAACGQRLMLRSDGHVCQQCNCVYCVQCQPQLPCLNCRALTAGDSQP